MSIDDYRSGVPKFNPHRRTTKVNISMVFAVALFFAAMAAVVWWFAITRP
jgi:hypothetical protein